MTSDEYTVTAWCEMCDYRVRVSIRAAPREAVHTADIVTYAVEQHFGRTHRGIPLLATFELGEDHG
jgi:hypothetical protein